MNKYIHEKCQKTPEENDERVKFDSTHKCKSIKRGITR